MVQIHDLFLPIGGAAMAEYIERNKLLLYLNDIWLTATPTDMMADDEKQMAICRCMGLNDAMDAVKAFPAADVREVVHGRWMKSYADHEAFGVRPFIHYCSVCNQMIAFRTFYCPNCGADMREVTE